MAATLPPPHPSTWKGREHKQFLISHPTGKKPTLQVLWLDLERDFFIGLSFATVLLTYLDTMGAT